MNFKIFVNERKILNRIQCGEIEARNYIWNNYVTDVAQPVRLFLKDFGEKLGNAEEYVHDAIFLLFEKAKLLGEKLIERGEGTTITKWLINVAKNFIRNESRKQGKFYGTFFESNDVDENTTDPPSDEGDDTISAFIETAIDPEFEHTGSETLIEVVSNFVNSLPEPLQTVVRFRFMHGLKWEEVNEEVKLKFNIDASDRYWKDTFWDRKHKNSFINQLIQYCKKHGYDFRQ